MKITWMNINHAKAAIRQMAEEGITGLLCPKCNQRLELRGVSFCPLGFGGGQITSFSIGEMKTSLQCPKCHAEQPMPTNIKKELAKRLAAKPKTGEKDANGEEKS